MIHGCRRKRCVRIVTGVTLGNRRNVCTRFRETGTRWLVTGITSPHGRGQVSVFGRSPGRRRGVAAVALTTINHVICRLVLRVVDQIRRGITVTGRAIPRCQRGTGPGVVHRTRHERDETVVMAGIALRPGRNMADWLGLGVGSSIGTRVTGRTLRRSPRVIHCCRLEGGKVAVTGVALCRRRDVRVRRLAQRRCSVMAGRASAARTGRVSIRSTNPAHRRIVAGITLRRRYDVIDRLGLGVGKQIRTAVTGRTITCSNRTEGRDVTHRSRVESSGILVTGVTGRRRRDVVGRLAQRLGSVVAG